MTTESEEPWREIVGVIRDIHDRGLDAKSVPTVFVPYRQFRPLSDAMVI